MGQVLVVFMFLLSIRFAFSIKPVKLVGKPRKLSAVLLCSISHNKNINHIPKRLKCKVTLCFTKKQNIKVLTQSTQCHISFLKVHISLSY